MITLYGFPRSSNALKVRFLLAELGLAYEHALVPVEEPRPDSFLALNPIGTVPTLVDEQLVLSESHAILRYLIRREGRPDLYGPTQAEAAHIDEWLDRSRPCCAPPSSGTRAWRSATYAAAASTPSRVIPAPPSSVRSRSLPTLRTFDALVSDNGSVLGRFTIADCAIAPVLYRTTHSGLDLSPYPNLLRLRETVIARPAFIAAGPVL